MAWLWTCRQVRIPGPRARRWGGGAAAAGCSWPRACPGCRALNQGFPVSQRVAPRRHLPEQRAWSHSAPGAELGCLTSLGLSLLCETGSSPGTPGWGEGVAWPELWAAHRAVSFAPVTAFTLSSLAPKTGPQPSVHSVPTHPACRIVLLPSSGDRDWGVPGHHHPIFLPSLPCPLGMSTSWQCKV